MWTVGSLSLEIVEKTNILKKNDGTCLKTSKN